jgi:ABC-2 type transport system ATP-binding protein
MEPQHHAPVLEAIGISKSYGARRALDAVSLSVRPGEVLGLLGPNGAGKTTTVSILCGLIRADSGRVMIDGRDAQSDRRALSQMVALVPQSLALYPSLSAAQNAWHFARMQGLGRADARDASARVLEEVGLAERAHDPVTSFSGGMKRRLNLACGMVHRPAVLVLDEPTVGVDLQSRERILALVRRTAGAGSAIIYTTHYMEEVERVCDRVLLLDRGKIAAEGTVEKLIALAAGRPRMELTVRGELPANRFRGMAGVSEVAQSGGAGTVTLEMTSLAQVSGILEQLRAAGVQVLDFSLHSPNLSDAFITLTGRSLRDNAEDGG